MADNTGRYEDDLEVEAILREAYDPADVNEDAELEERDSQLRDEAAAAAAAAEAEDVIPHSRRGDCIHCGKPLGACLCRHGMPGVHFGPALAPAPAPAAAPAPAPAPAPPAPPAANAEAEEDEDEDADSLMDGIDSSGGIANDVETRRQLLGGGPAATVPAANANANATANAGPANAGAPTTTTTATPAAPAATPTAAPSLEFIVEWLVRAMGMDRPSAEKLAPQSLQWYMAAPLDRTLAGVFGAPAAAAAAGSSGDAGGGAPPPPPPPPSASAVGQEPIKDGSEDDKSGQGRSAEWGSGS